MLYRHPIQEIVQGWLRNQPRSGALVAETLRRVDHFLDQTLLAIVSTYDRRSVRAS